MSETDKIHKILNVAKDVNVINRPNSLVLPNYSGVKNSAKKNNLGWELNGTKIYYDDGEVEVRPASTIPAVLRVEGTGAGGEASIELNSDGGDWSILADDSNNLLRIFSGVNSRMAFDSTGKVGIGTTTPSGANANVLLDTRGHIRAALSATVGTYYFSSAATHPYLGFGSVSDCWTFGDNNSYKMTINASNGRASLGTTSAAAKLHLETNGSGDGTFLTNGILIKQSNASTAGEVAVSFQDATATTTNYWIQGMNQSSKFTLAYGSSFSDANAKVTVQTDGNFGIGTVNPDEELTVYGTTDTAIKIIAQGTRSDANTPSARLYLFKDVNSGTVQANDEAGIILVNCDDASNNLGNSHQVKFALSGVTAGAVTSDIIFQTVQNASIGTLAEVLRLQGSKTLLSGALNLKNYTVATLPTGVRGDMAYVTDAVAPTYLGALTGGGTVVCPVFYDGTRWVSH